MERLASGARTRRQRSTVNRVFCCVEGLESGAVFRLGNIDERQQFSAPAAAKFF
jgi:hypothetical protein